MIKEFQGKYRFLSNFWYIDGWTVEHEFQAAKFTDPKLKAEIKAQPKPGMAKQRAKELVKFWRVDWHENKLKVMEFLVRKKFGDPILRKMLLDTGDEHLQEGNYWNDTFWGVSLKTGQGENNLGKILMKIREEIKNEQREADKRSSNGSDRRNA